MNRLLVVALVLLLSACTALQHDDPAARQAGVRARPEITFQGVNLTSGQILLSDTTSPLALLFSLMFEEFYPYVHAGILAVEDGKPYVYHATGRVLLHFSGPPTDAMVGRIKRDALEDYLAHTKIAAVYEPPPGVDKAALVEFARWNYSEGTEFDPYFDAGDREKLYCVEFVAVGLEKAGGTPVPLVPLRRNPSLEVLLDWLKIPARSATPAAAVVSGGSAVVVLGGPFSAGQVAAYFEMKRELHRRFTADQRLGNVFRREGMTLRWRDDVARFLSRGLERYARQGDGAVPSVAADVRALAEEALGPYPAEQVIPSAQ